MCSSDLGKLVVLAAALSAVAYAAPAMNPDTAVPEEEALVQSYAEAKQTVDPDVSDGQFLQEYSAAKEEYSAAKEAVFLLQISGKTDDACRQLATSEKDVVTKDVGTQQKLLDDLPSGKSCSDEGKDLVTKYEKTWKDLKSILTHANDEAKKAKEATVDFGPQNLDSMTGTCAIPKSNSKYQAAQKKASTAGVTVQTLNGQVDTAKKALKEAKDEHTWSSLRRTPFRDGFLRHLQKSDEDKAGLTRAKAFKSDPKSRASSTKSQKRRGEAEAKAAAATMPPSEDRTSMGPGNGMASSSCNASR